MAKKSSSELCVSIINRSEGKFQLLASLIKGIYHLIETGDKLHSYAGIGNYFLMKGKHDAFAKVNPKSKRANHYAYFLGEAMMTF